MLVRIDYCLISTGEDHDEAISEGYSRDDGSPYYQRIRYKQQRINGPNSLDTDSNDVHPSQKMLIGRNIPPKIKGSSRSSGATDPFSASILPYRRAKRRSVNVPSIIPIMTGMKIRPI